MAALAYVFLPVSGLIAFLTAEDARVRFHGLQAIALGLFWPVLLYAAAAVSERITQAVFGIGLIVWFGYLLGTVVGKDPRLPVVSGALARAALYEGERVEVG